MRYSTLIEIGCGYGNFTEWLIQKIDTLICFIGYEIDHKLFDKLMHKFNQICINYYLFKGDYLLYIKRLYHLFHINTSRKIIFSSIPYYVVKEILYSFITILKLDDIAFVIIQKELYHNLVWVNDAFSAWFCTFFYIKKLLNIPRWYFRPIPSIDSVFVMIHWWWNSYKTLFNDQALYLIKDDLFTYFNVLFCFKRKFLSFNLWRTFNLCNTKIELLLSNINANWKIRVQELTSYQRLKIFHIMIYNRL